MNDTLSRIKAQAERQRESQTAGKAATEESVLRRSEAAQPILKAFADIQHAFVRIDVLKRIWPSDYQRRPDRARGLLAGLLGGERYPYGLMLHIPGGQATFEVELTWDGKLMYVSSRETLSTRPRLVRVERPEPWLEEFYQTMSTLLEI
jgi:hypothetical protein